MFVAFTIEIFVEQHERRKATPAEVDSNHLDDSHASIQDDDIRERIKLAMQRSNVYVSIDIHCNPFKIRTRRISNAIIVGRRDGSSILEGTCTLCSHICTRTNNDDYYQCINVIKVRNSVVKKIMMLRHLARMLR